MAPYVLPMACSPTKPTVSRPTDGRSSGTDVTSVFIGLVFRSAEYSVCFFFERLGEPRVKIRACHNRGGRAVIVPSVLGFRDLLLVERIFDVAGDRLQEVGHGHEADDLAVLDDERELLVLGLELVDSVAHVRVR